MKPFVLIHGAWGGGWYWRDVTRALRQAGFPVLTPTLTGMGERAHLGHAGVNLETHIQDIVHHLSYEDLWEVTLVGHSYAGMVITGVADSVPERLTRLVYLDADLPEPGESRFDLQPEERTWWEERAQEGDGWRVNLDLPEALLTDAIPDSTVRRWYLERSQGQGQPIGTLRQPVRALNPAGRVLPRTFLGCRQDVLGMRSGLYGRMAQRAQADPQVQYQELEANHFAPVSAPARVVEALLNLRGQVEQ
ncbi:alpha/beta fold hydrolase [Deinococcus humi]|uniref:Pimeloyl-ACP methyl ester carboxylesterase n=1 Tax=Deinococcus humi TaxID=662880 RepID=A0A7W8JVX1_9DEIO|nr:alpha/beta hydrolase [Deinococcus humi]MBB5363955.1 pimeloyl-ACP methyl ester carboxylesterase [Deinococcus humi]GGO32842.1 esterase [Deinococcus humi]